MDKHPQEAWTTDDFIAWGQYLIAALHNGWDEDERIAIDEFITRFGTRDEEE